VEAEEVAVPEEVIVAAVPQPVLLHQW